MKAELKAAIALLDSAGYAVTKQTGQHTIQLVRKRVIEEEPFWKYTVNKYEKRYTAEEGQEIETCMIRIGDLKWKRAEGSAEV